MLGKEEMATAEDLGDYFKVPPDLRDLNYGKYIDKGEIKDINILDYNSNNTVRLDVNGMVKLLEKLGPLKLLGQGSE